MRTLRAITTLHDVVNQAMHAVEFTTHNLSKSGIDGAALDHFGFCAPASCGCVGCGDDYAYHQTVFVQSLEKPVQVALPEGGMATVGVQKPSDQAVCWLRDNPIPCLAAITNARLNLPDGGGYLAVRIPDLSHAQSLSLNDAPCQESALFGQPALRVDLTTREWGVGPGVYALYIVSMPVMDMATALCS